MSRKQWYAAVIVTALVFVVFRVVSIEYTVVELRSEFNGTVKVTENLRGYRFLRFGEDSAIQSAMYISDPQEIVIPYVKVALSAFAFARENTQRILIIGGGAGSMAMFARRYYPEAQIDVVDIDPVVVQVAREYFGFKEDPRMRVYVMDGREFVERSREEYDVVLLDAFNGSEWPVHLQTLEFFEAVRRIVRFDGVVASNVVFRDVNPAYDGLLNTQAAVFDEIAIAAVPGDLHNRIVLALPREGFKYDYSEAAAKHVVRRGFPENVGLVTNWTNRNAASADVIYRDASPTALRR